MRYVSALVLGFVALGPLIAGTNRLRRRFLPAWPRAISTIAVAVMTLAAITVTAEALGTIGQFRRVAMCISLAFVGVVAWAFGGPQPPVDEQERTHVAPVTGRGAQIVAALAVGLVVATWTARTIASLRHGMETVDTLWYHMPAAARFVQTGFVSRLHYVDAGPVTVFYPAVSPLLHGFGIQIFGNDLLSPLMNLGWLALALLSAWSIGEPYGVAPVTLTGAAVVLSTPGMVATQPGGAYSDVVGLALLLAAVALLVRTAHDVAYRLPGTALAALAAGLAVGTKFTLLVPVGALTLVVFLEAMLRRGAIPTRARLIGVWSALLFVAGGFFYLRNAVRVGNPLPSLSFGPLQLPTPHVAEPTFTIAQDLFRASVWRRYFVPGLWDSLGPAWAAIIGLTIVAGILAIATGRSVMDRAIGVVVLASIVGYVLTPQFLGVFPHHPQFFVFNVRYVTPALGLGLCLLPTVPALARPRRGGVVLAVLAALLAVTQYGPTIWSWSVSTSTQRFVERIARVDVVVGVVAGLLLAAIGIVLAATRVHIRVVAMGLTAMTAAAVLGYPLQQAYLRRQYVSTQPIPRIYRWAHARGDLRIALVGTQLQYPLTGKGSSNYVQYIGRPEPDSGRAAITTCTTWRRVVNAGDYDYVVVTPPGYGSTTIPKEAIWTRTDSRARLVLREQEPGYGTAFVYRVDGPLNPNAC